MKVTLQSPLWDQFEAALLAEVGVGVPEITVFLVLLFPTLFLSHPLASLPRSTSKTHHVCPNPHLGVVFGLQTQDGCTHRKPMRQEKAQDGHQVTKVRLSPGQ